VPHKKKEKTCLKSRGQTKEKRKRKGPSLVSPLLETTQRKKQDIHKKGKKEA